MGKNNIGTMILKAVLQQFYFEQTNTNEQHFIHLSRNVMVLKSESNQ